MKRLRVGFIGCGSFARGMHVPLLKANPQYEIWAAMDIDEKAAMDFKENTGAKYWTSNIDNILSDKEIDAIFIVTWHNSHAELSIQAARAGKHVFCEKPMGMNVEECKAVAEAVKKNNVKYSIGYNRGLAPMVLKAKKLLENTSGKKMIYHRIQAYFPESHWTHNPDIGGGRFIGEGCHIFDLICELIDKPPITVYATGSTFLNRDLVKIPDSAIVTITFSDGSLGTTLINSAGCPDFPKENTEIYCNNKAIQIHDFVKMEYYGFEGHKKVNLEFDKVDKGHSTELELFADAVINDKEPPNNIIKASRAAVISFKANESIYSKSAISICEHDYNF